MGKFQVLNRDKDSESKVIYPLNKNEIYTKNNEWVLIDLEINKDNYGVRILFSEIDTDIAEMAISNKTKSHLSSQKMDYSKRFFDMIESIPQYKNVTFLC